MSEYLKIPEVARRLDVSEKTARRYIRSAELPSAFIGGAYRVSEEDLDAYVRAATVDPEELVTRPKVREPLPLNSGSSDEERRSVYLEVFKKHMTRRASAWDQQADEENSRLFADYRTSVAYASEVYTEGFTLVRAAVKELWPAIDLDFAPEDAAREHRGLLDAVKTMLKATDKVKARDAAALERAIQEDLDPAELAEARAARERLAKERRAAFELLPGRRSA